MKKTAVEILSKATNNKIRWMIFFELVAKIDSFDNCKIYKHLLETECKYTLLGQQK